MGYKDPNITLANLSHIVSKFEGWIMGCGSSEANFSYSPNMFNEILDMTATGKIVNKVLEKIGTKKDPNEAEKDDLRRSVFAQISDSSQGAYYAQDIINSKTFIGTMGNIGSLYNLGDHLSILSDRSIFTTSPNMQGVVLKESANKTPDIGGAIKNASMKKSIMEYVGDKFTSKPADSSIPDPARIAAAAQNAVTNAAYSPTGVITPGIAVGTTVVNKVVEANPRTPRGEDYVNKGGSISNPTLENPAISSFVVKNRSLSYEQRRKDWLSIFFNGITPIEMSRCTPYVEITFYHQNAATYEEYYLNPVGYMRFNGGVDEALKLMPFGLSDLIPGEKFNNKTFPLDETNIDKSRVSDVGYMNMFTSPQTMANADINNQTGGLLSLLSPKKLPGEQVLEPFAPQATLNSLTLTTQTMGKGFVSEKRGTINLTIHDRSRIKNFAPLFSINQFAKCSLKITFGWSHPDGDILSRNDIGKFLDCMKLTQYYRMVSSNLRFQGSGCEVAIEIFDLGVLNVRDTPAAAGAHIPLRNVEPLIQSTVERLVRKEKAKVRNEIEDSVAIVHPKVELLLDTVNSSYSVVDTEDYQSLMKLIKENKDGTMDEKVIQKLAKILGVTDVDEDFQVTVKLEKDAKNTNFLESGKVTTVDSAKVLREKFETLIATDSKSGQLVQPDYFTKDALVKGTDLKKIDKGHGVWSKNNVSFGKCISNFVAAPLAATGEFSEIQVHYYPINSKAGGARIYTTASLPIAIDELRTIFEPSEENKKSKGKKKITSVDKGTMSAMTFFNKLVKLTHTTDFQAYGLEGVSTSDVIKSIDKILKGKGSVKKSVCLKTYYKNHKGAEEYYKKAGKDKKKEIEKAAVTEYVKSTNKSSKTARLKEIYNSDGQPPSPVNDFVMPNIQMEFEVLPALRPPDGGSTGVYNRLEAVVQPKEFVDESQPGYHGDGKILRIHIIDAKCNGSEKGELITNILNDKQKQLSEGKTPDEIKKGISTVSDAELRQSIKRHYPTLIYGAGGAVIKSVNVTSTTSDRMAQAEYTSQSKHSKAKTSSKNINTNPESITIMPSTVDLQLIGCPYIERNMKIYVDMGTNTDLDCLYTVNGVTHTLSNSTFTTSLNLLVALQGTVKSVRGQLVNKLATASKGVDFVK